MPNPKFVLGREELSDEAIAQTQNFKKLVYRYQRDTRPIQRMWLFRYKRRRWFLSLLLIVLVVLLIFLSK